MTFYWHRRPMDQSGIVVRNVAPGRIEHSACDIAHRCLEYRRPDVSRPRLQMHHRPISRQGCIAIEVLDDWPVARDIDLSKLSRASDSPLPNALMTASLRVQHLRNAASAPAAGIDARAAISPGEKNDRAIDSASHNTVSHRHKAWFRQIQRDAPDVEDAATRHQGRRQFAELCGGPARTYHLAKRASSARTTSMTPRRSALMKKWSPSKV